MDCKVHHTGRIMDYERIRHSNSLGVWDNATGCARVIPLGVALDEKAYRRFYVSPDGAGMRRYLGA